jgi:hypothetical protein
MTMLFTNIVKAQITQSLIKTLFERAGYRVTRLGVEEVFDEIIHLDEEQYLALNLPLTLRYLPNFLVLNQELNKAVLLEVKFRKTFDELTMQSLYEELKRQREYWPASYAVILTAQWQGRFHQDFIRIVIPELTESLNPLWVHNVNRRESCRISSSSFPQSVWTGLDALYDAFTKFKHTPENQSWQNADLITTAIRDLAKL